VTDRELSIVKTAKQHEAQTFYRLPSIPGIGTILSLVLLYAMHAIQRFPRVQDVVSSCRLVQCAKASAGTRSGTSGTTIGHASLQWAFAEAAVLLLRDHPAGQQYLARLEKQPGTGQAFTVLAQQWARAVSDMWTRDTVFDRHTFLQGSGGGAGEPAASLGHWG
jgi:transposase